VAYDAAQGMIIPSC